MAGQDGVSARICLLTQSVYGTLVQTCFQQQAITVRPKLRPGAIVAQQAGTTLASMNIFTSLCILDQATLGDQLREHLMEQSLHVAALPPEGANPASMTSHQCRKLWTLLLEC